MSHWNSSSLLADLLLKAINGSWNGCPRDFLFYGGSPSAADLQPLPLSSLIWSRHRLVNHIPFLVNLKLRMKNHHAGNCTDGSTLRGKEVYELLLLYKHPEALTGLFLLWIQLDHLCLGLCGLHQSLSNFPLLLSPFSFTWPELISTS